MTTPTTRYRAYHESYEGPIEIESDGTTTISSYGAGSSYFSKLVDRTDEAGPGEEGYFSYEWNHAGGSGKVRISAHIIFDLPELLAVMNAEAIATGKCPYGFFGQVRITRMVETEVESLFQETRRLTDVHKSDPTTR